MVTSGRPGFVAQAVRYFLRQDHEPRELIVVDASPEPGVFPADPRIHLVHLPAPLPLGAARNVGVEAASGDLVVHWDDDDWSRADRLARSIAPFADPSVAAAGLSSFVRYEVLLGQAWRYTPMPEDGPFVAGGTLVHRRSAWQACPFRELGMGEDSSFVAGLDPGSVRGLDDDGWFVAVGHGTNTAPVSFADPRWSEVSVGEIAARLGEDRAFYSAIRQRAIDCWRVLPTRAAETHRRSDGCGEAVTVMGDLLVYDGLGSMAEYALRALDRAGVDVRVAPIVLDRRGLDRATLRALARQPAGGPLLYWSWPRPELAAQAQHPELFVRTAWESTDLPPGWAALLDRARAVLVPSRFVADACRASGVRAPIVVVPDGVDPAVYHMVERPDRGDRGLTTLIVGTLIARKRIPAAIEAWQRAFAGDRAARLLIKTRARAGSFDIADPRIEVVDREEATRGIRHWYERADVLLALGNEGFGLPVVEAMATGLPVVALDAEGQHDVCRDAGDVVLAVPAAGHEVFDDPCYGRRGKVSVPDVEAAARHLRWVAEHRDEARDLGRAASAWATRHRSVWTMGAGVLESMEAHTAPRRRLRRQRTLWVPSWPGRCGISEYASELVRSLPDVRVSAGGPDGRGLRLLHVQHEDALFDDDELARHLESIDVPVTITEHSVGAIERAWEHHADVLVAHTDAGLDRLSARAGGRRVVRLHHGCPTWFPSRKRERGRTIGSFGFLEEYKGVFHLLEALRRVPGTDLVLHSHPRTPAVESRFGRQADGLPLRWNREYLPAEEVARSLAATCDVLVFWYDEVTVAAASGAVRVGLASGVPVLTSPTSWFADLAGATYQPVHLVEGLARLLDDDDLRADVTARAREHCHEHSWSRAAAEHLALWESLEAA